MGGYRGYMVPAWVRGRDRHGCTCRVDGAPMVFRCGFEVEVGVHRAGRAVRATIRQTWETGETRENPKPFDLRSSRGRWETRLRDRLDLLEICHRRIPDEAVCHVADEVAFLVFGRDSRKV